MKKKLKTGIALIFLSTQAMANEELAKDIKYISNDDTETKSQIICTNGNTAFVYVNNSSNDITLEYKGSKESLGNVTLDEIVNRICG